MAQNVSFKLGNANKDGLHKIYIRVNGDGKDFKFPTIVRIPKDHWNGKEVVKNVLKDDLNIELENEMIKIRKIILKSKLEDVEPTFEMFKADGKRDRLKTFTESYLKRVANKNTRKGRKSVFDKFPDITFSEMLPSFLSDFEHDLRAAKLANNTINSQMKRAKTLLLDAIDKGFIIKENVVKGIKKYSPPRYIQNIPVYLTENEINKVHELVKKIGNEGMKRAGYYFLLCCYTGYRISDARAFKYSEMVQGDKITIRAIKNKEIVSTAIHSRLRDVLDFIKDNPVNLSEKHMRDYLKDILGIAGITKKLTWHGSRHSFAMMLMDNNFTIDEVSRLIGDSELITKFYARVTNDSLSKKILERLG